MYILATNDELLTYVKWLVIALVNDVMIPVSGTYIRTFAIICLLSLYFLFKIQKELFSPFYLFSRTRKDKLS